MGFCQLPFGILPVAVCDFGAYVSADSFIISAAGSKQQPPRQQTTSWWQTGKHCMSNRITPSMTLTLNHWHLYLLQIEPTNAANQNNRGGGVHRGGPTTRNSAEDTDGETKYVQGLSPPDFYQSCNSMSRYNSRRCCCRCCFFRRRRRKQPAQTPIATRT